MPYVFLLAWTARSHRTSYSHSSLTPTYIPSHLGPFPLLATTSGPSKKLMICLILNSAFCKRLQFVTIVIQDLLLSLPFSMLPVHVKGHKDDTTNWADLTFQRQLNVECDRSAKLWLTANKGSEKSPQPTACVFHSEHWAVLHRNTKITSNVKTTLLVAVHGGATVKYLLQKYKWTQEVFSQIDWPAIGTVFGKISTPTRVKHSKLMHSWIPVMIHKVHW